MKMEIISGNIQLDKKNRCKINVNYDNLIIYARSVLCIKFEKPYYGHLYNFELTHSVILSLSKTGFMGYISNILSPPILKKMGLKNVTPENIYNKNNKIRLNLSLIDDFDENVETRILDYKFKYKNTILCPVIQKNETNNWKLIGTCIMAFEINNVVELLNSIIDFKVISLDVTKIYKLFTLNMDDIKGYEENKYIIN